MVRQARPGPVALGIHCMWAGDMGVWICSACRPHTAWCGTSSSNSSRGAGAAAERSSGKHAPIFTHLLHAGKVDGHQGCKGLGAQAQPSNLQGNEGVAQPMCWGVACMGKGVPVPYREQLRSAGTHINI